MEDCVSNGAIEIIKKVYQDLLLAEEKLPDVVYGSENQWGERQGKKDT